MTKKTNENTIIRGERQCSFAETDSVQIIDGIVYIDGHRKLKLGGRIKNNPSEVVIVIAGDVQNLTICGASTVEIKGGVGTLSTHHEVCSIDAGNGIIERIECHDKVESITGASCVTVDGTVTKGITATTVNCSVVNGPVNGNVTVQGVLHADMINLDCDNFCGMVDANHANIDCQAFTGYAQCASMMNLDAGTYVGAAQADFMNYYCESGDVALISPGAHESGEHAKKLHYSEKERLAKLREELSRETHIPYRGMKELGDTEQPLLFSDIEAIVAAGSRLDELAKKVL